MSDFFNPPPPPFDPNRSSEFPEPSVPPLPPNDPFAAAPPTTAPPTAAPFSEALSDESPVEVRLAEESSEPTRFQEIYQRITGEITKVFVGQEELVTGTLVAIFSGGHVLIESVPGLGKTLFVRTLGRCLGCRFGRIQFTPDLMPSDITGTPVFDMKTQEFRFRPGPVFTQLLLADEINRSPAKTHAALLEAMQENAVTVDNVTYALDEPFLVMATQNPIESEGTYHLPEAQVDRFMLKLVVNYPSAAEEAAILTRHGKKLSPSEKIAPVEEVTSPAEILELSRSINDVVITEPLIDYINRMVRKTREWPELSLGCSPRAGLALMTGSRTLAALRGRDYVLPDDILHLALPVLRHRVILSPEAEVEGQKVDTILTRLVRSVDIPRT